MALTLPASFKSQVEKPHGAADFLWLVEIVLDRGTDVRAPVIARICDGTAELQWPYNDPNLTTWYPFPFTFSPIEQTQEGDLSQVTMTIDNSTRALMRWLHDGNGIEGNPVTIYGVYRNGLSIPYPNQESRRINLQVVGPAANSEAVTIRLGLPNWFQLISPTERFVPTKCRWDYGGLFCGYVLNEFAAFSSCPKTLAACRERASDMVTRGLPSQLGNYGGHPGISQGRR